MPLEYSRFGKAVLSVVCCVCMALFAGEKKTLPVKGETVMKLSSTAFSEGAMIPVRYTCDGTDFSPPLAWSEAPGGVKSFALVCDDPDAPMGAWVHWVVCNIPAATSSLQENMPVADTLSDGTRQGVNDFRKTGYGGPCPPGGAHRYFFRLYALDTELVPDQTMTKKKLLTAMEGHVLGEAVLMGRYERR